MSRDGWRDGYVALVGTLGLTLLGWVTLTSDTHSYSNPGALLLLALVLFVGELRPIKVSHGDDSVDEITISCSFSLALALFGPLSAAVAAQVVATSFEDLSRGKQLRKVLFNVSQYTITLVVTRVVYAKLSGRGLVADDMPYAVSDLLPSLVAAVVFYLVNTVITTIVVGLSVYGSLLRRIRNDLLYHLPTSGVLLALAPALLVAVQFSPSLVLLLLLPIASVHKSARLAIARERQALHDILTGLPNRALLRERVVRALTTAAHTGETVTIMLTDLDHFKEVNDTLGHHVGDDLLCQVAARLAGAVRAEDTVARLGGDEFAVLAVGLDVEGSTRLGARLTRSLEEPFTVAGIRLDTRASVGIAMAPAHGSDVDILLQRADVALYDAKTTRDTYAMYDPRIDVHTMARLALLGDLREGLPRGEVRLHFQPKIDARTGAVTGVEALARWQHPERGLVPPDEFIAVAENTGMLGTLTRQLLEQAVAQAREWWDQGLRLPVAVNVSPRYLADAELPPFVRELLARFGLPGWMLLLEVTESTLLADGSRAAAVIRSLHGLGVGLSIDDFGSGYSSLGYLSRLSVDELKIDKSFVLAMAEPGNAVIVRSTIDLGHNLGLRVVAEGVETPALAAELRAMGCDVLQGFHIAVPMPGGELRDWLELTGRSISSPASVPIPLPATRSPVC